MTSATQIKPEKIEVVDVGYEDDVSLSPMSQVGEDGDGDGDDDGDEDVYEDSGDLDLSAVNTNVWLVRMPKFLRDKLLELENENNEQDLGTVTVQPGESREMKLILADLPGTDLLPHEYRLAVSNHGVNNTYVFSEQNLKGYNKVARTRASDETDGANLQSAPGTGNRTVNGQDNGYGKYNERSKKRARYQPFKRVNIPKKTSLIGKISTECSLTVSTNDKNYSNFVAQRQKMSEEKQRPQVTLLDEIPGVTSALTGPSMRDNSVFLKAQKREKERTQEGKASRIPRNELLDLLFKLFEEYDYWALRSLKERTRQPEAYLKEVLDSIAILNKKGPYSLKYSLKSEYKSGRNLG
ncbi:transcription initiation factor IIF, beta subunit [Lipomyces japonicus]|uniref:transcription initiation factor IIF, beta subunit n=1 Tax=Lipomyces japonicus TaxID=56871 RepID=UPI0034CDA74F